MKDRAKTFLTAMAGTLSALALVLGGAAVADSGGGAVAKLIPYQGTLEQDGKAVHGATDLVFRLYDGAGGGASKLWEETLQVQVLSGRFQALLGSSSSQSADQLAEVLKAGKDLYLDISVKLDGDTLVQLSNRQRFLPLPFALWTTAATNFKVAGDLDVGDEITADGPITTRASLHVNGTVYVGGKSYLKDVQITGAEATSGKAALTVKSGDQIMRMDGNELDSTEKLCLNCNTQNGAHVKGDLTVSGNLLVGLDIKRCSNTGSCTCPSGTKVIGGGGDCGDNAYLHESYPHEGDNRWHVFCKWDGGGKTPNASFAVCARMAN